MNRNTTPRLVRGCFLAVALLCLTQQAGAAPYRPTDDALVLERVAGRPPAVMPGKLEVDVATRLARIHIERSRQAGDPRELGYAQGLLQPWWNSTQAPAPILLLRATLKQARHDFPGALSDLDQLLKARPDDAQAWLTRATVLRVQGHYPEALAACTPLQSLVDRFIATLCEQSIRGLNGGLDAASQALESLFPALSQQSPGVAAWYLSERADMAVRAGKPELALTLYQQARIAFPADLDLIAAHADVLLDQGKPAVALEQIPSDTAVDALLLRRALALHALSDSDLPALDARLREGFAAAHRRGEALHLREETRYRLAMGDDPRMVVELAQRNWQVQHEPWDARLLLAAAKAAASPSAAEEVQQWLRASRLQDARLKDLR